METFLKTQLLKAIIYTLFDIILDIFTGSFEDTQCDLLAFSFNQDNSLMIRIFPAKKECTALIRKVIHCKITPH